MESELQMFKDFPEDYINNFMNYLNQKIIKAVSNQNWIWKIVLERIY